MRRLGELEARIMQLLWSWDRSASVREVLEALSGEKTLAYTTVMTVLDNLHSKQWLGRERDGRAYRYRPVATREDYVAELMRDALGSTTDPAAAFVRFTQQLDESETEALRQALRRRRKHG